MYHIFIPFVHMHTIPHHYTIPISTYQDTCLFNDTLLHNIRYGNLKATMAEVEAAAEVKEEEGVFSASVSFVWMRVTPAVFLFFFPLNSIPVMCNV